MAMQTQRVKTIAMTLTIARNPAQARHTTRGWKKLQRQNEVPEDISHTAMMGYDDQNLLGMPDPMSSGPQNQEEWP